jgi:hypothetical protein
MEIAPGGCYPQDWPAPPRCWPPEQPAPEPDPDTLDAAVDWLTHSHHELYQMVHSGLDLAGAMAVSAQWARLGDELAGIGAELEAIVGDAAASWHGKAADLARDTLAGLTHWATDAGTLATKVAGCVSIEVDNATNARDAMPAPPNPRLEPPAQTFTTGEFAGADRLVADPAGPIGQEKALHAQAARAMEQFQQSSREVYGTVPQFSPPQVARLLATDPPKPPPPQPQPRPDPVPTGPPTAPRSGAGSPGTAGQPRGSVTGTPSRPVPPAAPRPGIAAEPAAANRPVVPGGTTSDRPGRPSVGGMPMGGGASRGDENIERTSPEYLKEDEDVWGLDEQPVAPPVIGEGRHRA